MTQQQKKKETRTAKNKVEQIFLQININYSNTLKKKKLWNEKQKEREESRMKRLQNKRNQK